MPKTENLIDFNFTFYDECVTIADYIEEHLYDTITWQLPLDVEDPDENYANIVSAEAMEQVIAILATRFFNRPRRELIILNTNDND